MCFAFFKLNNLFRSGGHTLRRFLLGIVQITGDDRAGAGDGVHERALHFRMADVTQHSGQGLPLLFRYGLPLAQGEDAIQLLRRETLRPGRRGRRFASYVHHLFGRSFARQGVLFLRGERRRFLMYPP